MLTGRAPAITSSLSVQETFVDESTKEDGHGFSNPLVGLNMNTSIYSDDFIDFPSL